MDHNAQGRRPHNYHRGRRGSDRRGGERRAQQPPEHSGRSGGDHVEVEQIMRDIRARIAQRHGIDLTTPQVQELAARRLEAILDPRTMSPTLTEQLRKAASNPIDVPASPIDGGYEFDERTLFDTHRGLLRLIRRLLHPILKLFFNPTPLIQTLHTQARLNKQAVAREAERERRQTEWNALHYEILSRLVTEVSRVSIEVQALSGRVESLAARVDFTDRRVRTMESAAVPARPALPRGGDAPSAAGTGVDTTAAAGVPVPPSESPSAEGTARRKRRRRRGRRSGVVPSDVLAAPGSTPALEPPTDTLEPFAGDEAEEEYEGEVTREADALSEPTAPAAETSAPPTAVETSTPSPEIETSALPPADTPLARPAEAPERPPAESAPVQPAPPPDEPVPAAPVDQPDPGPPDR